MRITSSRLWALSFWFLAFGWLLAFGSASSVNAQEIKYSSCENCWNADSLGNHRAVVEVKGTGRVAKVNIPWRRRDYSPKDKNIIVTDRQGKRIRNVTRGAINREFGEIYFEPAAGAGEYYCYYLPYQSKGRSNYPVIVYPPFVETADAEWKKLTGASRMVAGKVTGFQSIDELNSFYPMELIATRNEVRDLLQAGAGRPFLVFPEDRLHPIVMKEDLPYRWIKSGPSDQFSATASRGENFTFQLGIYAGNQKLEDVKVQFSDLRSGTKVIAARNLSCLNTEGTGWDGKLFTKRITIGTDHVQALWCMVNVPPDAQPGAYETSIILSAKGVQQKTFTLKLSIDDKVLTDGGVTEPWKQTRLTWLNSTMAMNDEVIEPYSPLTVNGQVISLLGRKFEIGSNGLPASIQSYFTTEMTSIGQSAKPVVNGPFEFIVEMDKAPVTWKSEGLKFTEASAGVVRWEAVSTSSACTMEVHGRIEFDGFVSYTIKLTSTLDASLDDARMIMPLSKASATYMLGLGQTGGFRPPSLSWKWDVANKNQDGAWIGEVNAGLQFSLRDENYSRPLNTNFYLQKPLVLPTSWGNEGKGGIEVDEKGNSVLVTAYSGPLAMKRDETKYFNFTLLITPFHALNTDFQWKTRFYHRYSPVDSVIKRGSTVANIHHANAINPYINYPFVRTREMKAYIDEAHDKGIKVKIYNTIRELSNRAYETQPMRSLGTEIYSPGAGGGFSWLQEHIGDNYIAAWFVPDLKDAAIINSGMSRWHNYYVEGMNWLVKNIGIDGIYLDDVAFDRTTMKRIRRVLRSERGPGIIDLHSANQYNKRDGFNNSANLYLEHFPYLDRLWFGEYFDYDKPPDFWLTEVSGIPFGLMGEMLEKGGNKWRGLLYGMTNRMPYDGNDPSHIWKAWDAFGMQQSEMIGYWVPSNPVKADNPDVKVTIYRKRDAVMIAVASWANEDVPVKLSINWKALALPPAAAMEAPPIPDFQSGQTLKPGDSFVVPKGKGMLLWIKAL